MKTYDKHRVRRGVAYLLGGRAVQGVARAALILMIVRILSPEDYGAYMLIIGISEMLLSLSGWGIPQMGQRYLPQLIEHAHKKNIYKFVYTICSIQVVTLALTVVGLMAAWPYLMPVLGFTDQQISETSIAWLLFFCVPLFRFIGLLLEALLEQGSAQVARAMMPIGRLVGVTALFMMVGDVDIRSVILIDAIVTIGCLGFAAYLFVTSLVRIQAHASGPTIPLLTMATHTWHMALAGLLETTQSAGALRMVLAETLGVVEVGLFAFLQNLQRLIERYLPGILLQGLIRPVMISRLASSNGTESVNLGSALIIKANLLVIGAASVVLIVCGDQLIAIASGSRFLEAGDTLLLMFLALAATSMWKLTAMMMQIFDQTALLRTVSLIGIPVLALVWWAGSFGLNYAVAAMLVGPALACVIGTYRLSAINRDQPMDWKGALRIVLCVAVCGVASLLLEPFVNVWVRAALVTLLMLPALWVAKPLVAGEVRLLQKALGLPVSRFMLPFARP